jgi:hypothetical protein
VGLGVRIRRLSHLRLGVAISLVGALLAAVWSVDRISLAPPGLTPRAIEMATATTSVLVDTPDSIMVDLRQDTSNIDGLTNRAIVLANVLASASVEARIAQEAAVPLSLLRIQAPLTPRQAALQATSQGNRKVTDILRSNNQYRIDIVADAEVPMLDIYAQTPTTVSAAALANAAVDQLRLYLASVGAAQHTPAKDQVRLEQLGRATGAVITGGVKYQLAALVFLLTFLAGCATATLIARVRAGWRLAVLSERATSTN